jgi:acyl carrier protein
MKEVLDRLQPLVIRTVRVDSDVVSPQSRFEEIPGWSSLRALRLFALVETEFDVQLDLRTYLATETVVELAALIARSVEIDAATTHVSQRASGGAGAEKRVE